MLCFREKVCDPFSYIIMLPSIEFQNILPFVLFVALLSNSFAFYCSILLCVWHALIKKQTLLHFIAAYCYVWHALIKKLSNWWIRVHYFWMTYSLSLVKWRVICMIAINLFWNMWQWKKKKISGTYSIESWPYPILLNFIENVVEILNVSCHNCIRTFFFVLKRVLKRE